MFKFTEFTQAKSNSQDPSVALMVKPLYFNYNNNTSASNAFQHKETKLTSYEIRDKALHEFNTLVNKLLFHDIKVIIIDETKDHHTPDAVFPNNWITFHHDGSVVIYPMMATDRRLERKLDVPGILKDQHKYFHKSIIDLSFYEKQEKYLEGTGSLAFDHENRIAYACQSPRTHPEVISDLVSKLSYKTIVFQAFDSRNIAVYHTNVMLSISKDIAILCSESIKDPDQRKIVVNQLKKNRPSVIEISFSQLDNFCGNVFFIVNKKDQLHIIMSSTAHDAFSNQQIYELEKYGKIIYSPVPTIEKCGGGSVRCMMAAVHLPSK